MPEPKPKDKAGDKETKESPPRPPGFRNFQRLLKQVVKAPPMRNARQGNTKHPNASL